MSSMTVLFLPMVVGLVAPNNSVSEVCFNSNTFQINLQYSVGSNSDWHRGTSNGHTNSFLNLLRFKAKAMGKTKGIDDKFGY